MTPDDESTGDFTVRDPQNEAGALPRMDFSTFVLSLAASAMVNLGQVPLPGEDAARSDPSPADLPLARQTIDTLEMIQEKTRGNLDDDEAKLLQTILYELRMAWVKAKATGSE